MNSTANPAGSKAEGLARCWLSPAAGDFMESSQRPSWWLAPQVHAAALNGDIVFLSVADDAYFCLPGGAAGARLSQDRRRISIADAALALSLRQAGLVADRPNPPAPAGPQVAPTPTTSALRANYQPPTWEHLSTGARAVLDVTLRYRRRNLSDILAVVTPRRQFAPPATPALLALVDDFHRWVPFAPVSAKCLLRSFMLLRLLRRTGHDALWVFGVRTWPFHAHCWLQCEGVVLDDQPDRVAAFAPILVV